MRTVVRLVVALVLACCGLVALPGTAHAATPQIYIPAGPYAPDQAVGIGGTGCPASAPVSLDIWDTAKPSSHVDLDHATDASAGGAFLYSFDLDHRFDPGAQLGFFLSCTATVQWGAGPTLEAMPKYGWVTMPAPHVDIVAPATIAASAGQRVIVRTDSVLGGATLTLDGTTLPTQPDSVYGWWHYELPANLTVGGHLLHAVWDPTAPDAPTVTDDAVLDVLRVTPALSLAANRARIRVGHRVRLTITLSVPGAVTLLDGKKSLRQLTVPASGTVQVKVRLKGVRGHRLRAVFAGDARAAGATSAVVKVRVRR